MSTVYDPTQCALGEGPLWHPARHELFWFDILRFRLHSRADGATRTWQFDEHVSAAGWVDEERLMIASETKLFLFNLTSGVSETVVPMEEDVPGTRSNDGRADPWGGFWIGTMSKAADPRAGAIYRYYRGELRVLYPGMTIPNAISFSPDGGVAYFADTVTKTVMRQRLRASDGWPDGDAENWLDLTAEGLNPDGAVVDAQGNFWNAQWGANRVAAYDPAGHFLHSVAFAADQTSCPAFGGQGLTTLYCTSARTGLPRDRLEAVPEQGMTFAAEDIATGQAEHRVVL